MPIFYDFTTIKQLKLDYKSLKGNWEQSRTTTVIKYGIFTNERKTSDFCYHLIKVHFIVVPHLLGIFFTPVILGYLTSIQFLKMREKNSIRQIYMVKSALTCLLPVDAPTWQLPAFETPTLYRFVVVNFSHSSFWGIQIMKTHQSTAITLPAH